MIEGLKEVIDRHPDAYYYVIEKYFRNTVCEGYYDDVIDFECPGYKISDEIYIGDGILRIVLIEE